MSNAKWLLTIWALVGIAMPSPSTADDPATPTAPKVKAPVIVDVALAQGGVLTGQVVDPQGAPMAKTAVQVVNQQGQVTTTESNATGQFTVQGLTQGGVHRIAAAGNQGVYRLWAPGTAPPGAITRVTVVSGQPIYRAQYNSPKFWLASPWVPAAILGAAVGIPVALNAANDDDTPASP